MRAGFESLSRKYRAAEMRSDALACERAGFPGLAAVAREMADAIDPPQREVRTNERRS